MSKSQLSKMQEISAFVLSSSFSYSSVSLLAREAIAPHTVCCSAKAGGAAVLRRRGAARATGACVTLWHIHPEGSVLRPAELYYHSFGTASTWIYISPVPFSGRGRASS